MLSTWLVFVEMHHFSAYTIGCDAKCFGRVARRRRRTAVQVMCAWRVGIAPVQEKRVSLQYRRGVAGCELVRVSDALFTLESMAAGIPNSLCRRQQDAIF
jgi:hypothetical protein